MKVIETKVFHFAELSGVAKEVAISWYRESSYEDDFWASERQDSFNAAKEIYKDLNALQDEISGARLYTWLQNNVVWRFIKPVIYQKIIGTDCFGKTGLLKDYFAHSGATKTRRSKVFSYDNIDNCPLTGVCYDYDFLKPIIDFLKSPDKYTTNEDLTLPDYSDIAQRDYDYQNTDEYIIETIEANEYEFTEDGKRW